MISFLVFLTSVSRQLIIDPSRGLTKISGLIHIHPFKIPIVWGDSFPVTNHMIVAVFSVYAEISFIGVLHQQKVSGIYIVLESVWTNDFKLSEETLSLVRTFVKENSMLKISRNLTPVEKQKVMKVLMETKAREIESLEDKQWLHFLMPTNVNLPSFGLPIPSDVPFRVFECLVDVGMLNENEDQIFGNQYFYFLDEKTKLIEQKAAKAMFNDFPKTLLDPQWSSQFYLSVHQRCANKGCCEIQEDTVDVKNKILPNVGNVVLGFLCRNCGKIKKCFLNEFHVNRFT